MRHLLLFNSVPDLGDYRLVALAVRFDVLQHLDYGLYAHNALSIQELFVLLDHTPEVQQPDVVLLGLLSIVEHADRTADESVPLQLLKNQNQPLQLLDQSFQSTLDDRVLTRQEQSKEFFHGFELGNLAQEVFCKQGRLPLFVSYLAPVQLQTKLRYAFGDFMSLTLYVSPSNLNVEDIRPLVGVG